MHRPPSKVLRLLLPVQRPHLCSSCCAPRSHSPKLLSNSARLSRSKYAYSRWFPHEYQIILNCCLELGNVNKTSVDRSVAQSARSSELKFVRANQPLPNFCQPSPFDREIPICTAPWRLRASLTTGWHGDRAAFRSLLVTAQSAFRLASNQMLPAFWRSFDHLLSSCLPLKN